MANIGLPTLLFILLIALLLFGPSKLPELGRAFGKTLREFKKGAKEIIDDEADQPGQADSRKPTGPLMAAGDKNADDRRLPE